MKTINITLKIKGDELLNLEDVLRNRYEVIDLKILPNTDDLYNNDPIFKKLIKDKIKISKMVAEYVNLNN